MMGVQQYHPVTILKQNELVEVKTIIEVVKKKKVIHKTVSDLYVRITVQLLNQIPRFISSDLKEKSDSPKPTKNFYMRITVQLLKHDFKL